MPSSRPVSGFRPGQQLAGSLGSCLNYNGRLGQSACRAPGRTGWEGTHLTARRSSPERQPGPNNPHGPRASEASSRPRQTACGVIYEAKVQQTALQDAETTYCPRIAIAGDEDVVRNPARGVPEKTHHLASNPRQERTSDPHRAVQRLARNDNEHKHRHSLTPTRPRQSNSCEGRLGKVCRR